MKSNQKADNGRVKDCKCYCTNCAMNYCGRCENHTSDELMSLIAIERTQGLIDKRLLL